VRFAEIAPPESGGERAYVLSFAAPPAAEASAASAPALPARPVHYDFELLGAVLAADDAMAARPLAELDFVVFDTETTGLNPTGGDRLIQLGAIRMRGGAIREAEIFDELIDPGMPIPPASIRFHGITDADVAGAPDEGEVLRRFHDYAAGCVLVAHNAAFDMRFLQLGEAASGRRFENPVLDMLLLSVAIHADYEDHTLDGLASRFDVEVRDRHTALGDARVTASIFARMLDLLAADGIVTLEDAFAASRAQITLRRLQERF
jgi:DNA polymerase-3 subunit epsilon